MAEYFGGMTRPGAEAAQQHQEIAVNGLPGLRGHAARPLQALRLRLEGRAG